MAASYQLGYRIATIVAGAVPLVLADHYGWNLSYAVMAALMGIGVLGEYLGRTYMESKRRPVFLIRTIYEGAPADAVANESRP